MTLRSQSKVSVSIIAVFSLLIFLGCQQPGETGQIERLQKEVSDLKARVGELERSQQTISKNQDKDQQELMKALQDMKPALVQLKTLQEYERERELFETPAEKVKRAMQEVRSLATAVQSFATDANLYPEEPLGSHYKVGDLNLCRVVDMAKQISPNYIKAAPAWDPWGNPYLYWVSQKRDHFLVLCMGQDGIIDPASGIPNIMKEIEKHGYTMPPVTYSCFETDIVWYDDGYVQFPQGPLKNCNEKR